MSRYSIMSNQSSCRVLRTLGMDGFLGFKCGPSCSEKQHNKEIKALIDAIDDLLAYDLENKKELGAKAESFEVSGARIAFSAKLDGIKNMADRLGGTHRGRSVFESSDQPREVDCDAALTGVSDTVDLVTRRVKDADIWQKGEGFQLSEKDREELLSQRDMIMRIHFRTFGIYKEL
jgi:hypothetical protein